MQEGLYYKYCRGCQKTKPSSEFGINRTKPRSKCKECISEYNRAKYKGEDYQQKEYLRTPDATVSGQYKICTKCGIEKPLDDFYKFARGRLGRYSWCKPCSSQYNSERAKRPDRKEYKRWAFKEINYGISQAEYKELHELQHGRCAGCGATENRDHLLCVDHDHETGRIRGLLCHDCNRCLGFAGDDPSILVRLVLYLEESALVSMRK